MWAAKLKFVKYEGVKRTLSPIHLKIILIKFSSIRAFYYFI